ncbi:hypothetical protein KVT40_000033 [Elsinoe batatas]|uniref:Uncharacterized protein n=1 Tax=Elsinoe batatas TaxID=2601811 RepID=A0A8K0LET9_9PEZI|nr:hypothetical protein KVT40_000033 [Elsinoe batatas]
MAPRTSDENEYWAHTLRLEDSWAPWQPGETFRLITCMRTPNDHDRSQLDLNLGLDQSFWTFLYKHANGFFRAREHHTESGDLESYRISTRSLFKRFPSLENADRRVNDPTPATTWTSFASYSKWEPAGRLTVLVNLERAQFLELLGISRLLDESLVQRCVADPYAFHAAMIEQMLHVCNLAIWSVRKSMRLFEDEVLTERINKPTKSEGPVSDVRLLEVPEHFAHCSELAASAGEIVEAMVEEHATFIEDNANIPALSKRVARNVSKDLKAHRALFKCLGYRAASHQSILSHNISMAIVKMQQRDSQIQRKDSKTAAKIAELARADSSSTKTISVLGLLFLPSTFVCSLFSTTFFSLQPASDLQGQADAAPSRTGADRLPTYWLLSDRFWIFWAVSIPLTLFTLSFWYLCTRGKVKRFVKWVFGIGHGEEEEADGEGGEKVEKGNGAVA